MSDASDTIDTDRRRGAMGSAADSLPGMYPTTRKREDGGATSAGQQVAGSTPVAVGPRILPCPFCGAQPNVHAPGEEGIAIVECPHSFDGTNHPECYADGDTLDVALAAWNRRPDEISPSRPLALPPSSANCHLAEKCQLRHLSIDINKDLPNTPQEGILQIAIERNRQIRQGFTPEHDDQHTDGSLARCAQLILMACEGGRVNHRDLNRECDEARNWYFGRAIRVARRHTLVQCLAIAGAMIAAEIDRLTRLQRSSQLPPLSPVENPDLNRSEQRQQSEERDPIAAKDGSVQLS